MKPDFEAVALELVRRIMAPREYPSKAQELVVDQLRLAYQEGIVDGLRQSVAAIKAAFDKYQGRVEP